MARVNIEELVSMYKEVLDFDNKSDDLRIYVFANKDDLVRKYIEKNLLGMKIKEPITGEKYDDTFKEYLEEIRILCNSFEPREIIIIGVYGKYVDSIDIHNNDVRLYHLNEISLLSDDIKQYYNNR